MGEPTVWFFDSQSADGKFRTTELIAADDAWHLALPKGIRAHRGRIGSGRGGWCQAVDAAADFERSPVAFTTLIGEAKKAGETLLELRELGALRVPGTRRRRPQADRLRCRHLARNPARIGNMSAGIRAPVNRIAEDINLLAGRGIPIIGELTKQFGVSDFEVKKLVESSPQPSGRRSSRSPPRAESSPA